MDTIAKSKEVLMNTYGRFPLVLTKGEGAYVYDETGKKYLDFSCGISVNNLGHCYPAIVEAIKKQSETLLHASNLYWTTPQLSLAEKIIKHSGLGKVFFSNSGAEANEGAIKLARKYWYDHGKAHKNGIITMNQSFHGRTLATLTATGQEKVKTGFSPLMPGFSYVDFNDFDALKEAVSDTTAAVMLEPVQGEGGIHAADKAYLKKVKALCEEKELLLIFDEIQCGLGRCGEIFCYKNFAVTPDIVTLAKSLGGGLPMGAFVASEEVAASFGVGTHGSTFGGNPVAAAAGNAYLTALEEENLMENVKAMGDYFIKELKKIESSAIVDVRGLGLLIGMEVAGESSAIVGACLEKGVLLLNAGTKVVRFAPPLNCNTAQIDEAVAVLKEVMTKEN